MSQNKFVIQNVIQVYKNSIADKPLYLRKLVFTEKKKYDVFLTESLERARKFNSKKWLDLNLMPRLLGAVAFAKIVRVQYHGYSLLSEVAK